MVALGGPLPQSGPFGAVVSYTDAMFCVCCRMSHGFSFLCDSWMVGLSEENTCTPVD